MNWVQNLFHLLGKRNITRYNNFWDNIEPLKYVTWNGQKSRTKVYRRKKSFFYLMLNLFETINEKEAIYGLVFGGQENNITISRTRPFS